MSFDPNYYKEKLQDKAVQRGKIVNRLIDDIYAFVKQNEEVLKEFNDIEELMKAESLKVSEEKAKQKDEPKVAEPAGSKK